MPASLCAVCFIGGINEDALPAVGSVVVFFFFFAFKIDGLCWALSSTCPCLYLYSKTAIAQQRCRRAQVGTPYRAVLDPANHASSKHDPDHPIPCHLGENQRGKKENNLRLVIDVKRDVFFQPPAPRVSSSIFQVRVVSIPR